MDDGYGVGPPSILFDVVQQFIREVEEHCGLVCQRTKCEVFSWDGVRPRDAPADFAMAGIMVEEEFVPGFIVYGVPVGIGTDQYVTTMLEKKVEEIEANAMKVVRLLEMEKQSLWRVLRSSIQHQFGYWLMLVNPTLIREAAMKVDRIMIRVLESMLGYRIPVCQEQAWAYEVDVPVDSLSGKAFHNWVVQQPVKFGGLGLRSQAGLSPVAYLACLEQTIPFFTGEKGICPALSHLVGRGGGLGAKEVGAPPDLWV